MNIWCWTKPRFLFCVVWVFECWVCVMKSKQYKTAYFWMETTMEIGWTAKRIFCMEKVSSKRRAHFEKTHNYFFSLTRFSFNDFFLVFFSIFRLFSFNGIIFLFKMEFVSTSNGVFLFCSFTQCEYFNVLRWQHFNCIFFCSI